MSQEDIALALGVRRAGVTIAISSLSSSGCIYRSRGKIEITDRKALIDASSGCYP
jgi:DNA-binding MarR family transcriptional regulator